MRPPPNIQSGSPDRPHLADRLRDEFRHRRRRNSRYSLRAFARDLQTDHSSISKLLRGEREPSPELIDRLAHHLGLSPAETAAYRAAVALPSPAERARLDAMHHFAAEAAAILNEPLHHTILQLTARPDFQPTTLWISAQTSRTPDTVNIALQRLLRLGYLRFESPTAWLDTEAAAAWTLADFRRHATARVEALAAKFAHPPSKETHA